MDRIETFRDFLEVVGFDVIRRIRKNLGKYQPGNFGIEIEYRADVDSSEIDYDSAWEAFNQQVDSPTDPSDWQYDNPEPEKPDKNDYRWNPRDMMVNYWNLDMEDSGMPGDFPLRDDWLRIREDDQLKQLPYGIKKNISQIIDNLNDLWNKSIDYEAGPSNKPWNRTMFSSMDMWERWKSAKRMVASYIKPSRLEQQYNIELSDYQYNFIERIYNSSYEILSDFVKFHEKRVESITEEDYRREIVDKFRNDLSDYKEKLADWQEEYKKVKDVYDAWDEDAEFQRWLDRNDHRFTKEGDISQEIQDVEWWLKNQGKQVAGEKHGGNYSVWNVYEDETGVVEIATPILNISDFGFLKKLLRYLQSKDFDDRTGLHVHIGMPTTTDSFDLLAMAYLTDEESILQIAQRTTGSLTSYAKKKDVLFQSLYDTFDEGVYDNEKMYQVLERAVGKHYGVNFISAFTKYGTVEFRYLSSQIVNEPERLFRAINYFLTLPRLAQTRTQIQYQVLGKTISFTRLPGARVEVHKFTGQKRIPRSSYPAAQLRQPVLPPAWKVNYEKKKVGQEPGQ